MILSQSGNASPREIEYNGAVVGNEASIDAFARKTRPRPEPLANGIGAMNVGNRKFCVLPVIALPMFHLRLKFSALTQPRAATSVGA